MEKTLQVFLKQNHPEFMLRLEGDKNYGEVKHINPDKGNFLARLMATGRYANGLSMGDQESDEGMFKAMIQANSQIGGSKFYSVIVSKIPDQETSAEYRLRNPQEVHQFLSKLILPEHRNLYPY
jgi:trehalose-6-phosphatase